jgi:hypothetical protein
MPGVGNLPVENSTKVVTKWFYPLRAGVGLAWTPHPAITLCLDAYWVNWSRMYFDYDYRRFTLYFFDMKVRYDMKDTLQVNAGAEWRINALRFASGPKPIHRPIAKPTLLW